MPDRLQPGVPSRFGMQNQGMQMYQPTPYARLVNPMPLSQTIPNLRQSVRTVAEVSRHQPVKDGALATLDDHMKRLGSFFIAGLATLGMRQRIFGVSEFLGFASWFGAMALTPQIIYAVVRLKTGLNLGQQYDSTYGQRQNLFKDPNYLPLHLLPETEIKRVADKLGIPATLPNRRQVTEEKIRQIAVQANTWWMLVAGPATPVISGLVCDRLEGPATRMVNGFRKWRAESTLNRAVNDTSRYGELPKRLDAYLKQEIGAVPESNLTNWWRKYGREFTKKSGLMHALSVKDVVKSGREDLTGKILDHLSGLKPADPLVDQTLAYLDEQHQELSRMLGNITGDNPDFLPQDFIKNNPNALPDDVLRRMRTSAELEIGGALNTLNKQKVLFNAIKQGADRTELRRLMEKSVLAEVQRLVDTGYMSQAEKLAGGPEFFGQIRRYLGNRQFGRAFKMMGASPQNHLLTALREIMLRKRWQRRVGVGLGGLMLGATALYNWLFVGRDFNKGGRA